MGPRSGFGETPKVRSASRHEAEKGETEKSLYPPEMEPDAVKMRTWINTNRDDFSAFLEYGGDDFKILPGDAFYCDFAGRRIVLKLSEFKEAMEGGERSLNEVHYFTLHELAHLKRMRELDRAGKHNQMAQFQYESKKRIRSKDDPAKFLSIGGAYRHFNNILEDAIVNSLVNNTRHFGENVSPQSRARLAEIKRWYLVPAFSMYRPVEPGTGAFMRNPDPIAAKEEPYVRAPEGTGDLDRIEPDAYAGGFDWNEMEPKKMGRAGQFVTFFIKNQMSGLSEADAYDPVKNPNGKHVLHPDAALLFTHPLVDAYGELLKRVQAKYADDPAQRERYYGYMSQVVKIPVYREIDGKIAEDAPDLAENTVNPSCVSKDKQDLNVSQAKAMFRDKFLRIAEELKLKNPSKATFLDVFAKLKERKKSTSYSWTLPLKHNLVDGSRVMRQSLEPLYTMLCILDDSFDVTTPPEAPPGGKGQQGPKPPESRETPEWQPGDRVRNVDPHSPFNGQKGIITNVTRGAGGNIASVTVEYLEDDGQTLSGGSDEVFEPNTNLKLLVKGRDKPGSGGPRDPRKQEKEDEKEKEPDEDEGIDEDDTDGEEETNDEDLEGELDAYGKMLEKMIKADERKAELKKIEDEKKTPAYREKVEEKKRAHELEQMLTESEKSGEGGSALENRRIVEKFQKLERELAPYSDEMARAWLDVIQNITTKIEAVKDKFYREGKPDIKRLQRFWPEIEAGMEIDQRLIYEKIVERISVELRPKMVRLTLAIDNSGSMNGKIDAMRMAIMLLNNSLRSLRVLFKDRMKEALGESNAKSIDLVCDTELYTFGVKSRLIKRYDVRDFAFLEDASAEPPELQVNRETLATLKAFKKINANEGGTEDEDLWPQIVSDRCSPEYLRRVRENLLTELVIQISDGDITGEATAIPAIEKLKESRIGVAGFAVGSGEGEASSAEEALKRRHGENVIRANTPQEIVTRFGALLRQTIVDRVERPLEKILEKI